MTEGEVVQLLSDIWHAGVKSVSGRQVVEAALKSDPPYEPDLVIAIGKAASGMCLGALSSVSKYGKAIVVTKYEHVDDSLSEFPNVQIIESGHPLPDEKSLLAGRAISDALQAQDSGARLLFLVSGGASALAEVLPDDMTLDEWQKKTEEMIASGMSIDAINAERKNVSLIKNGKLLQMFHGREARVYAISDVEGDDIRVIGSGIACLKDPGCENVTRVIGTNAAARSGSARESVARGFAVQLNEESLYEDVFDLAPRIVETLSTGSPGVYIWGGEPTIQLPDKPGKGGRNQSLALVIGSGIIGRSDIAVLVAGTDGTDGPTNAAGAIVNGETCDDRAAAERALSAADAGSYLGRRDCLFITGATNTNVMDLVIALVQ